MTERLIRTNRIEVFKGKGRVLPGWFYRIVSSNGQTVVVSESFVSHWNAKRAARKTAASWNLPVIEVEE